MYVVCHRRRCVLMHSDELCTHWTYHIIGRSGLVVSVSDCGVRRPRFESYRGRLFITTATAIYSLGHGLCTFTAVPRSTQPSTLRGTVKWVSAFGLSNNKMAMVDVDSSLPTYRRTHSPSRLAWSEGWRSPGAESAFIKWTGWTLAMALRHDDSTTNIVVVLLLLLWICLFSSILQVGPTIPVAVSLEKHRYN